MVIRSVGSKVIIRRRSSMARMDDTDEIRSPHLGHQHPGVVSKTVWVCVSVTTECRFGPVARSKGSWLA